MKVKFKLLSGEEIIVQCEVIEYEHGAGYAFCYDKETEGLSHTEKGSYLVAYIRGFEYCQVVE